MHDDSTNPAPAPVRPPYEAPRVLFRQPIEKVAADCTLPPGKATPIQGCTVGSS